MVADGSSCLTVVVRVVNLQTNYSDWNDKTFRRVVLLEGANRNSFLWAKNVSSEIYSQIVGIYADACLAMPCPTDRQTRELLQKFMWEVWIASGLTVLMTISFFWKWRNTSGTRFFSDTNVQTSLENYINGRGSRQSDGENMEETHALPTKYSHGNRKVKLLKVKNSTTFSLMSLKLFNIF